MNVYQTVASTSLQPAEQQQDSCADAKALRKEVRAALTLLRERPQGNGQSLGVWFSRPTRSWSTAPASQGFTGFTFVETGFFMGLDDMFLDRVSHGSIGFYGF